MSQATVNRRQRIMAQLLDKKQVTVKELASVLDVSNATVRRDLRALADEQGLNLTHGGASLSQQRDYSYQAKALRATEAKSVVGRLAGGLVRDGDHIFLDSGTTCSEVVPHLKQKHDVTVLANSARFAPELEGTSAHLFMIGGEYRPARMDTVGPMAMASLNTIRGYIAFIGTDGINMEFGPSASDIESAHLHRQVVQNASATNLLVDHSKFGSASLFQIVDWSQIDQIVTDRAPPTEWVQFFSEKKIDVVYPAAIDPEKSHP
ncbi:MAG: DeoR/GlpR family DNA-binding transcription regulator [Pirellulales bacterium]|nr:DeoR/GlpR family DNA-binding transcription regulator [Pirellulales bacterium]